MSSAATVFEDLRLWVGGLVVVAGLFFLFLSQVGQLRLPDIYTRIHAAGLGDGVGAGLLLAGLAITAPSAAIAVRLLLVALLIWSLAPVLAHLGANAAHSGGVAPVQDGAERRTSKGRAK